MAKSEEGAAREGKEGVLLSAGAWCYMCIGESITTQSINRPIVPSVGLPPLTRPPTLNRTATVAAAGATSSTTTGTDTDASTSSSHRRLSAGLSMKYDVPGGEHVPQYSAREVDVMVAREGEALKAAHAAEVCGDVGVGVLLCGGAADHGKFNRSTLIHPCVGGKQT